MNNSLGLYLHVPFCLSKCGYCDFYSLADLAKKEEYVTALCRALKSAAEHVRGRVVDTVFFGGGTPSLLTAEEMERIFLSLGAFSLASDAEITVEVNPATAKEETLSRYRALGVNRISIGMQSACDKELSLIGRRHSAEDTAHCVRAVRAAGFDNFSLDLIYGLPYQTRALWHASLRAALSFEPKHLSLYALSLSEGVPMKRLFAHLPTDDECREFYRDACALLAENGLKQYEISNFAREGFFSRHNLRYWMGEEYLGFGPAAASFYGGRRYTEDESLDAFLASPENLIARISEEAPLTQEDRKQETLMLRLRLNEGLSLAPFLSEISGKEAFEREVQRLVSGGFCRVEEGRLFLTEDGFFVQNEILSRLLLSAGL